MEAKRASPLKQNCSGLPSRAFKHVHKPGLSYSPRIELNIKLLRPVDEIKVAIFLSKVSPHLLGALVDRLSG